MKRFRFATLVVVVLLGILAPFARAYSGGIDKVAQYFPADFEFLATVRTDDAYLDDLQSVVDRVSTNLPQSLAMFVKNVNLRDQIDQSLQNSGLSYDKIRAWLGNCVAIGVQDLTPLIDQDQSNNNDVQALILIEITDRAALEAILPPNTFANATTVGKYTVLNMGTAFIALNDNWLAITTNTDFLPGSDSAKLDGTAGYQSMVGALPADSYNALAYIDLKALSSMVPQNMPNQAMLESLLPQHLIMGATILDGTSLTLDIAQDGGVTTMQTPVQADFANFIPSNAQLVIHSANLTDSVNTLLDYAQSMQGANGNTNAPDVKAQLSQIFAVAGLSAQEDVLSWTTGDYATFASVDFPTIFKTVNNNSTNFDTLPGSFGLILQATDAAKAQNVATTLGATIKRFTEGQGTISVEDLTVGDLNGSLITTSIPVSASATLPLQLFIGANNDILYIGTLNGAQAIVDGNTLANSPAYQSAQNLFVGNASQVAYTSSDGVVTLVGVPLVLLAPSIGNIFSNIVSDLNGNSPAPTPTAVPMADQIAPLVTLYDAIVAVVDSTSISGGVNGDITVVRAVITLK